jgi:hypothetical protein
MEFEMIVRISSEIAVTRVTRLWSEVGTVSGID